MTAEQKAKIQFVKNSGQLGDYVRCPTCEEARIAAGRLDDICKPFNADEDLLCPCGDVRLPYDCQAQLFDLTYPPDRTA